MSNPTDDENIGENSRPTPGEMNSNAHGNAREIESGRSRKELAVNAAKGSIEKGDMKGAAIKGAGAAVAGEKGAQAAENIKKTVDNAKRAKKVTEAVVKAVKPFMNIYTAIAVVVALVAIVVFAYAYSTSQVIGRNENADGCGSMGGAGSIGAIKMNGNEVDKESAWGVIGGWLMSNNFKFLGNKPMTKEQAAAVIGNMTRESELNPGLGQVQRSTGKPWILPNEPNSKLIAGGNGGGTAAGLIQWDGERRAALGKYADSKGKLWSDPATQLEFMATELEGSEGAALKKSDFAKPGLTVEQYTIAWDHTYERSGIKAMDQRIKGAKDFFTNFNGASGAVASSGGSCLMGGGSFDASGVVALAVSISWPFAQRLNSRTKSGDPNGCNSTTDAYKAAKVAAEAVGGKDGYSEGGPCPNLYASCDRFVATVIKQTVDKDIPWGSSDTQHDYLAKSPKWQAYTNIAEKKPGDIWTTYGHIMLYVGNVDGIDAVASASYTQRSADINYASQMSSSFTDGRGRKYIGYHYVGG